MIVASIAFGLACVIIVMVFANAIIDAASPETFVCDCCEEALPTTELYADAQAPEHRWCKACVEDEGLGDEPEAA